MSGTEIMALRALTAADLDAAHGLSRAVAWPHRIEDWRLMSSLGHGVAAVDASDALQGVAMWWPQGADFATLGMVIVSPTQQKSGIGRRLMAAAVEAAGERRIQLNATVEGLRLYRSFGFEEIGGIHQHQGVIADSALAVATTADVRPLTEADRASVLSLDLRAFGGDRTATLATLLPLSQGWVSERPGGITGYLLVRDFGRGKILGPLVATDGEDALALLSAAAVRTGGFLRADIPDDARIISDWLNGAGLSRVGEVRTMLRGGEPRPHRGPQVFGLASQALG